MVKLLFLIYFSLIQAFGLLGVVTGAEEISFLSSEMVLCYTQEPVHGQEDASRSHHHARGHSDDHSAVSVPKQLQESDLSQGSQEPFIHCSPITVDSINSELSIPSELPKSVNVQHNFGIRTRLTQENQLSSNRDLQPSTPPPQNLGALT